MVHTIIIPEELRNYLQGLAYDIVMRQELLLYMLNNNMNNKKMFDKIQTEYTDLFVQFELSKIEISELYVPQNAKNVKWSLNFRTCEVCYGSEN